jgi:cyclic pyranopterin phosphate synthase
MCSDSILARAGLDRDGRQEARRPGWFVRTTHLGHLTDVLPGTTTSEGAELSRLKVDAVVMRGSNDEEGVELAQLGKAHSWHLRSIEPMPLQSDVIWGPDCCLLAAEIGTEIEMAFGPLVQPRDHQAVGGRAGVG